jgi:hypothetical protein
MKLFRPGICGLNIYEFLNVAALIFWLGIYVLNIYKFVKVSFNILLVAVTPRISSVVDALTH